MINGLEQGNRNAQNGIFFCQTAEGALEEMTNMYQRIRQLAVQSANGTNSDAERQAIQQEVTALCDEIKRIGEDTTFGGIHLLNKSLTGPTEFQVGANANETISIDLSSGFRLDDVFMELYNNADADGQTELLAGGVTRKVKVENNANAFTVTADFFAPSGEYNIKIPQMSDMTVLRKENTLVSNANGAMYAEHPFENGNGGTIRIITGEGANQIWKEVRVSSNDSLADILNKTFFAHENGSVNGMFNIRLGGNERVLSFLGDHYGESYVPLKITTTGDERLKFFEVDISADANVNDTNNGWIVERLACDTLVDIDGNTFSCAQYGSIYDSTTGLHIKPLQTCDETTITINPETTFSVSTESAAQSTIGIVDKFIETIAKKRAELGAVQNRLESAISNQENVAENLYDARSRIRDADYATETAEMTRQSILQQVSTSILVNANQKNEIVLSLLQKCGSLTSSNFIGS